MVIVLQAGLLKMYSSYINKSAKYSVQVTRGRCYINTSINNQRQLKQVLQVPSYQSYFFQQFLLQKTSRLYQLSSTPPVHVDRYSPSLNLDPCQFRSTLDNLLTFGGQN